MSTHRPAFIASDAIDHFGASHAGIGAWIWADFVSREQAERFALFCALDGYGVYLSRMYVERNRVCVNPTWDN